MWLAWPRYRLGSALTRNVTAQLGATAMLLSASAHQRHLDLTDGAQPSISGRSFDEPVAEFALSPWHYRFHLAGFKCQQLVLN